MSNTGDLTCGFAERIAPAPRARVGALRSRAELLPVTVRCLVRPVCLTLAHARASARVGHIHGTGRDNETITERDTRRLCLRIRSRVCTVEGRPCAIGKHVDNHGAWHGVACPVPSARARARAPCASVPLRADTREPCTRTNGVHDVKMNSRSHGAKLALFIIAAGYSLLNSCDAPVNRNTAPRIMAIKLMTANGSVIIAPIQ